MEYIVYTRAIEQLAMILFATAFVLIGFSVIGALWGTVIGYALAALSSVVIFKFYMPKYIPKPTGDFKFPFREELKLAGMLVKFSIPVIITAIAEMLIYNICTLIMGRFLSLESIGFFTAADPIARLPLMISISVATTILPASSEAFIIVCSSNVYRSCFIFRTDFKIALLSNSRLCSRGSCFGNTVCWYDILFHICNINQYYSRYRKP